MLEGTLRKRQLLVFGMPPRSLGRIPTVALKGNSERVDAALDYVFPDVRLSSRALARGGM